MNEIEPLLGVENVAEFLDVPKMTVYHWRATGYGPKGIKVGRYIRYRPADVRSWVENELSKEK